MQRTFIRGVEIEHMPTQRGSADHLRYTIDIYDAAGSYVMLLGQLADLAPARAAWRACVEKYPDQLMFLRYGARIIARSDRPEG